MESGFYKNDNGKLLFAPNFVYSKDYELLRERRTEYELPVDDWYWFNTRQDALDFFGIEEVAEEEPKDKRRKLNL